MVMKTDGWRKCGFLKRPHYRDRKGYIQVQQDEHQKGDWITRSICFGLNAYMEASSFDEILDAFGQWSLRGIPYFCFEFTSMHSLRGNGRGLPFVNIDMDGRVLRGLE